MRFLVGVLSIALPLGAAEFAVLKSGARLQAQRIERADGKYVLYAGEGRIELPEDQVAALEHEDDPAVAAAPAAVAPVVVQKPVMTPKELVTEAALRHGLPPEIVHALAQTESAYRADAVSPKGAMGVMQLMPSTAKALAADPANVEQNIDAGTRLLRDLLVKYENDPNPVRRALAAYNAGEGAVSRYGGVPPYRETQAYVEKVLERYWKQVNAQGRGARSTPQTDSSRPGL
ncbi:MAG: lytic transglycosylase domain-containing protein [Acidobacteria bacterium]|nr:lytic transglycosylase domain-containing protein [Acidobacteriota bacterium]